MPTPILLALPSNPIDTTIADTFQKTIQFNQIIHLNCQAHMIIVLSIPQMQSTEISYEYMCQIEKIQCHR